MWTYVCRRLVLSGVVVAGVTFLTFIVARLVPGDPAALYAGPRPTGAQVEAARARLGLDQPVPMQFLRYAGDLLSGNFGTSLKTHRPIVVDLAAYLPPTLELAIAGMTLAGAAGTGLGALAGAAPGGLIDVVFRIAARASVAMPVFWLGLVLQLIFFRWLGWLPISGRVSNMAAILTPIESISGLYLLDAALAGNWPAWRDASAHLILPALTLASFPFGVIFRMVQASVAESMTEPFVRAGLARGVPWRILAFRHALRHALPSSLNVIGLSFVYSLTGAVLVEFVFSWPGLGRYLTDAILASDFPVMLAVTVLVSFAYSLTNLVIDVAQALLDPRITLL